jgi:DNA repair photolyase
MLYENTVMQSPPPDNLSSDPSFVHVPLSAVKGRGSATRLAHRYESLGREPFDDGWLQELAEAAPPLTQWVWEDAKSAITRNRSPDIGFDLSINPYRGCEHGCSYCYARPSHSYLGLSPGLDFETRLIAKRGLQERLIHELASPRYRPGLMAVGTITDAYQPLERELGLTRGVLQVLHDCRHPMAIVTKGSGIERDIDLLAGMASHGLAGVYVSVTTLDAELARRMEPRAAAPWRRLQTIRRLADAGIPVGVSVSPQIPFINDDMEQVLEAARDAGATSAFYVVLRLPWELSPLFRQWLDLHYPDRAARVMARMHDLRGGKDYDASFATRRSGQGIWADLIAQRFAKACRRLGLNRQRHGWNVADFRPPSLAGQMGLF